MLTSKKSVYGYIKAPSVSWDNSLVSPRSSQTARFDRATPPERSLAARMVSFTFRQRRTGSREATLVSNALDASIEQAQCVILKPRNSPAASNHVTSTLTTLAPEGPTLQNRNSSSTLDFSPSAIASTRPSRRFRTHPTTPKNLARSVIPFLKSTPCTLPLIMICALASKVYNTLQAVLVIDSLRRCSPREQYRFRNLGDCLDGQRWDAWCQGRLLRCGFQFL